MMSFCGNCDAYTNINPRTELCRSCTISSRNGGKIIGGAAAGGLLGGPVGFLAGGIIGSLLGEDDETNNF